MRAIGLVVMVSAAVVLSDDSSSGNDRMRTPCRSPATRAAVQEAENVAGRRLGLEWESGGESQHRSSFDWMDLVSWNDDSVTTPFSPSSWRPGDAAIEVNFSPSIVAAPVDDDAVQGDVWSSDVAAAANRRGTSCSPPMVATSPVFCEDAAGCPPNGLWEESADVFRTIVVGLPALMGVLLFVGHAARQWMRWRLAKNRAQRASCDGEEVAVLEDRVEQPPLVFSLVEREARRAAQRAKLSADRRPSLLPSNEFGRDRPTMIPLPVSFMVGGERLRRAA